MKTYSTPEGLRTALESVRSTQPIVFVPTMGALHAGHEALLVKAREIAGHTGLVVASIFVNPIQFDNAGDLASYPQTIEEDMRVCEHAGVDYVFMPTSADMYFPDRSVIVDEHMLSDRLCGATRPGHFSGVCTVVLKLFNIVGPTDAVFGKKDYQQLAIIRRMVRDLDVPVKIHGVETVREVDGLALSSRNRRLSERNRANAPVIRASLLSASEGFKSGVPTTQLIEDVRTRISACTDTRIDYVEIVDATTLAPYTDRNRETPALMAVAVFFGDVRLIDNIEL